MTPASSWFLWAVLAAIFAALTAIFTKVGVKDVDPDLATLIRTAVVLLVLLPIVWLTGKLANPLVLPLKP